MSAISIVATAISYSSDSVVAFGTSGAAIGAGMPCYLSTTDGKYYPCDTNLSAAAAVVAGLNVATVAAADLSVSVVRSGTVNLGATLTVGGIYVAGAGTAGDIDLAADLTTGWYVSILGVAITAALLKLNIFNSGVAHA